MSTFPAEPRSGDAITARYIHQEIQKQIRLLFRGQTGMADAPGTIEVNTVGSQEVAIRSPRVGRNGGLTRAQIVTIYTTYLECTTPGGQTILVARPEALRSGGHPLSITYENGDAITYVYDGTNPSYKRTSNDGTTTITQILIPNYFVNEVITAASMDTGLAAAPAWMDINATGRQWVEE